MQGKEWAKQGIYYNEEECVAYAKIDDFQTNVTPEDLVNKMKEQTGGMDIPHHLEQEEKMRAYRVATEGSVVSDESNITLKEKNIEEERARLQAE